MGPVLSAWAKAWGGAWGAAWGAIAVPPIVPVAPVEPGGGGGGRARRWETDTVAVAYHDDDVLELVQLFFMVRGR